MALPVAKTKKIRKSIIALSVFLPLAVASLFFIKIKGYEHTFNFLPRFYTSLNGTTAILLLLALFFVKKKQYGMHQRAIQICMGLSIVFLICYVIYHLTSPTTFYGDLNHDGLLSDIEKNSVSGTRLFYVLLLLSHILLSIAVVPLVLYAYLHAWEGNFEKHKKWTRFAWPIWFYVAVTGVVVFWMISPYYA